MPGGAQDKPQGSPDSQADPGSRAASKVGAGRKKTGGRTKGTPNKTTGALKDMILQALSNKGGIKYLEQQADENPTAFMTLVGKVLPLQVNAEHSGGVTVEIVRLTQ
jgi:hypothetical protein